MARTKSMGKKESSSLGENIRTIVYAVLIALVLRTFAFEPFNIPSGSMMPTLLTGDYLFVSKYSYGYSRYSLAFGLPLFNGRIWGGEPERGEVVVFRLPTDPKKDYIKRVIGLPGDRVQMRDGRLFINGEQVERQSVSDFPVPVSNDRTVMVNQYIETLPGGSEHMILEVSDSDHLDNTPEYEVPAGHYFMMGDNRDRSQDSRVMSIVGFVPEENLVGRAEIIWFSLQDASFWQVWRWPTRLRFGRLLRDIS
ncbi:MAG: signal peptidase I [Pseudomonadota bacterium]